MINTHLKHWTRRLGALAAAATAAVVSFSSTGQAAPEYEQIGICKKQFIYFYTFVFNISPIVIIFYNTYIGWFQWR